MTPLRWALVALGVVLVANVLLGADRSFAKSEARRYAREADSLRKVAARVDTIFVRTRDTLYRRITRLDSVAVEVERWKHDTIRVVEFVALADSTARACLATISACEAQVAVRDAQIDALNGQLRATLAQRPGLRERLRPLIIVGGLAYLAGRLEIP